MDSFEQYEDFLLVGETQSLTPLTDTSTSCTLDPRPPFHRLFLALRFTSFFSLLSCCLHLVHLLHSSRFKEGVRHLITL